MELSKLQALFKWSFVYVYICCAFYMLCGSLEGMCWFIMLTLLGGLFADGLMPDEA